MNRGHEGCSGHNIGNFKAYQIITKKGLFVWKIEIKFIPWSSRVLYFMPNEMDTFRGSSFKSVAQNYGTLQEVWYESKDLTKDREMKARIIRVESQMRF